MGPDCGMDWGQAGNGGTGMWELGNGRLDVWEHGNWVMNF